MKNNSLINNTLFLFSFLVFFSCSFEDAYTIKEKIRVDEVFIDNEGRVTNPIWIKWFVDKHKLYPTEEAFYEAAQSEPRKSWKKIFKVMKKEKCISKGVTIGGDNADVYMPQFINFFKDNLL